MISAIIVNYKSANLLQKCAKSVADLADEIIVVNHSSEESLSELNNISNKAKIYIRPNRGYAAGCNYGAKMSSGDYLLFLNPDVLFKEGSLKILSKTCKQYRTAVAPKYLNSDGTFQPGTRKFPELQHIFVSRTSPIRKLFKNTSTQKDYFGLNLKSETEPVILTDRFPLGGCFIIPRELYEEIGGFDERFFLFFEDADFFKRLYEIGKYAIYEPRSEIIHLHGFSRKHTSFKSEWHKGKSFYLYLKKHSRQKVKTSLVFIAFLIYNLFLAFRYFINIPIKEKQWA